MKYIAPTMQIEEAIAAMMIADSLKIVTYEDKTVNGEMALAKGDNAWDIWSE